MSRSADMMPYDTIRRLLAKKQLDGLLVTNLLNIRYLTGFSGSSAALFIGRDELLFFTDFRYKTECERLLEHEDLVIVKGDPVGGVVRKLRAHRVAALGFEYGASYQVFDTLRRSFSLSPLRFPVEKLRMVKREAELGSIREAVRRAEKAYGDTKKWIRPGVTERKVALVLEEHLKREGCRRLPFDIIVASGRNAALPHARVSEKKIEPGDLVIVDWGGEADGYMSDMTRTVLVGGSDLSMKKRIYDIVLTANVSAIRRARAGMPCRDVDATARAVIRKAGFADYFGHGTGHGVGLNVHEMPSLSPRSRDRLADGMVFTVEPGIYIPDVGGVRIEDLLLLRKGRAEYLTALPKDLEIL